MAKRTRKPRRLVGGARLTKAFVAPPRAVVRRREPLTPQRYMQKRGIVLNTNTGSVYQRYLTEKEKLRLMNEMKNYQLSDYTQNQLMIVAKIQNKAKTDDYNRQRIKREQEILGKSMNILNTPYVFTDNSLDVTREDNSINPIMAPNVFKEREDNPHLLKQQRLNILQTKEAGNNLMFG